MRSIFAAFSPWPREDFGLSGLGAFFFPPRPRKWHTLGYKNFNQRGFMRGHGDKPAAFFSPQAGSFQNPQFDYPEKFFVQIFVGLPTKKNPAFTMLVVCS